MRFSFMILSWKGIYLNQSFSVADRQKRCAVCLRSHFALICLFLRLNRHSEIFLFCYDCFFRIRKMLVLVCSAFCTAYCFDCYYFLLCKKMRLLASNSRQHFRKIAAPKNFFVACGSFFWNDVLRKTNCVRFGRIASLSACVLFAGGCVVRITYESFLDCSLLEVFCF